LTSIKSGLAALRDFDPACDRSGFGLLNNGVLANEAWANERGVKPLARLVAYGIAAVEPGLFGLGPIPAVKLAYRSIMWMGLQAELGGVTSARFRRQGSYPHGHHGPGARLP
jgi:acetyl-CoA acetyltransferase